MNNMVYVCSPYRGDAQRNREYARELTAAAVSNGLVPVTVHLYLTEVLDDSLPEERRRGMEAGQEILRQCSFILVGGRYGISEGMKEEIRLAYMQGLAFIYEENGRLCLGKYKGKEGGI